MGTVQRPFEGFNFNDVTNRAMSDSRLFKIAQSLNRKWHNVRMALLDNGYSECSHSTYLVARELQKCGLVEAMSNIGCDWNDVDKYHLNKLVEGSRGDYIMYVLFSYPALSFHKFYYKERNAKVYKLLQGEFVNDEECSIPEQLMMLKERMEMMRLISMDDEVVDELESEIEVLGATIEFIDFCDAMTEEVDDIFDGHIAGCKHRLEKASVMLDKEEMEVLRSVETKKISNLAQRFEDAVYWLTTVSLN